MGKVRAVEAVSVIRRGYGAQGVDGKTRRGITPNFRLNTAGE